MPEVTAEEVEEQSKKMAKKKVADTAGMVAEMLQNGGPELNEVLAEIFTAIMRGNEQPPEFWKTATMRVLYKAGGEKDLGNYRLICLLPILYKVFSKI